MKPNGIAMVVAGDRTIGFALNRPSKVEDAIWEAVELAIDSGWTPEQFKNEIADAWRDRLTEDAKDADAILSK